MIEKPRDYTAVGTNGELEGLAMVTRLLADGWIINRVDTAGGRFVYLLSRPRGKRPAPLMLGAGGRTENLKCGCIQQPDGTIHRITRDVCGFHTPRLMGPSQVDGREPVKVTRPVMVGEIVPRGPERLKTKRKKRI